MDRTGARAAAMMLIYEWQMGGDGGEDTRMGLLGIRPDENESEFMDSLVAGVQQSAQSLDETIEKYAANWRIDRIERVTLAILRLAIYELSHEEVPASVVINEALELTRTYASPESVAFVNGILGSVQRAGADA